MTHATLIHPDLGFKKRLLAAGGAALTQCFQCGTCTVACRLSPDRQPFPRKELHWAQWGLKERLMADPDIWLCYQCNDCSQLCPREADPSAVLAAIRQSVIEHYARPGFLARMIAAPKWLPALLAAPALLMALAIWLTGGFSAHPAGHFPWLADGIFAAGDSVRTFKPVNFDHFFAHYPLIFFFTGLVGLSLLGGLAGIWRYWNVLDSNPTGAPRGEKVALGAAALVVIKQILTHHHFKQCEASARHYWGHLLLFYGFLGMLATTTLAAILYYTTEYPFGLWHPVKILGNLSGLIFLGGIGLVIAGRFKKDKLAPRTGYLDWLFLTVIAGAVMSGILCQAARLADAPFSAYTLYFIHLLLVFFLLVYLPYSKFAHLLYRTVALVYARHLGRVSETGKLPKIEARVSTIPELVEALKEGVGRKA